MRADCFAAEARVGDTRDAGRDVQVRVADQAEADQVKAGGDVAVRAAELVMPVPFQLVIRLPSRPFSALDLGLQVGIATVFVGFGAVQHKRVVGHIERRAEAQFQVIEDRDATVGKQSDFGVRALQRQAKLVEARGG